MPFKSDKQRRYLFANEPEIAKRWNNMYKKNISALGAISYNKFYDTIESYYEKEGKKSRLPKGLYNRQEAIDSLWNSYKNKKSWTGQQMLNYGGGLIPKLNKITGLGAIKPTISEIKSRTLKKAPYFFSKNTMKFFGQRMSDYKVKRSPKGKIFIYAPTYDTIGNKMPYTFMEFKNEDLIAQKGIYESESEIKKYISKK